MVIPSLELWGSFPLLNLGFSSNESSRNKHFDREDDSRKVR